MFLDRINRIYKIMSIDELCYKVIGAAMAVHRLFSTNINTVSTVPLILIIL